MISSLLRPPRSTTLFPYTTLFRSRQRRVVRPLLAILADHANDARADEPAARDAGAQCTELERRYEHVALADSGVERFAFQDRKSTRLNSSHVSISYAVFCLKKKRP